MWAAEHTKVDQESGRTASVHASEAQARAQAVRAAGALGTDAKYKNTRGKVDPETGEILGFVDPMAGRVQRFILQSVSRKLLPESRTNNCLRVRQGSKQIQVHQSVQRGTACYSGLQTCGSVWACPVCAAKIAERRRAEIIAAMAAHNAAGGCVHMLTLTAPHQRGDDLAELLSSQAKALNSFWNDRQVKAVLLEMGTVGQIRALEVTHGRLSAHDNGWHPHYHILLFNGLEPHLMRFKTLLEEEMTGWMLRLYAVWARVCVKAGLGEPSLKHGLKLDDGSRAAKYVSKWGLEDEMTKGHTKKALHGETPFDLLRAVLNDEKDRQAAALFIEFARVFKGKRQLHWSRGLKARYAIGEKNDDELAQEKEDDLAVLLGTINVDQWRDVLAVEGRGDVLSLASRGGWPAVVDYLASIRGRGARVVNGLLTPGCRGIGAKP
jgi:pyrimidine deaminase RibD-like protein